MDKLSDGDILKKVMYALQIESVQEFSDQLGYKSHSSLANVINGYEGRNITDKLANKITSKFPNVNREFLKTGVGKVLLGASQTIAQKNIIEDYTLNDLPMLILASIEEQKKTNVLLERLIHIKSQKG